MSTGTSPLRSEIMDKLHELQESDAENTINSNDTMKQERDDRSDSEDELISFSDDNAPGLQAFEGKENTLTRKLTKPTSKTTVEQDTLELLDKELHELQKDYQRSRRDLKISNRENRDQSLELRDLKKAIAHTQERNAQLREQNCQLLDKLRSRGEKISKSERNKFIDHFEAQEDHIAHLQYERTKREAHMRFLTDQTREANEEKSSIEAETRKLQRQVRDLSANLTECKDDLLRLQPTSQVSDNEIAEQYSNLDQQITAWVDDQTEDSEILEDRFNNLKSPEDLPELFQGYINSDHLRMANKYPASQPSLLRYLIHCHLGTSIFDKAIYLFGLDARNVALLQGLEEGMKLLEPRRDAVTVRRWRSESLQALLKMPSFIEEQQRQAQLVSKTLQSALSYLITSTPSPSDKEDTKDEQSGWEELHTSITLPAIALATKLRLSTSSYTLTSRLFTNRDPAKATNAFVYEIKDSCMIDIATEKVLRPDSVLKIAEDGRIGEEMLVVTPALLRVQGDGKSKMLVCKPTILVKLDEPMQKRGKGIKALGLYAPSWLGGGDA